METMVLVMTGVGGGTHVHRLSDTITLIAALFAMVKIGIT